MATCKSALTEQKIKALKPAKTVRRIRDGITDSELKGFGVTVIPSGSRSFFLHFTSPEKKDQRRYLKLGDHPKTSLSDAREKAREARRKINAGIDPIEEAARQEAAWRAAQAAVENQGTVNDLFDLYIRDMEMAGKRAVVQVRSIYQRDIKPTIGDMKTKKVTWHDCADVIQRVVDRGALVGANRTRTYLRAAFQFGMTAEDNPRWRKKGIPNFDLQYNPAAQTIRPLKHERPGDRNLSREEVRFLWNSIGVDAMEASQALALKLLLATGQRVEEVLGATWDEFDREQSLWTIPARRRKVRTKVTEPHLVPLTEFHWQLLDEIKRYSGKRYLFPHRVDTKTHRGSDSLSQAVRRFCQPQRRTDGTLPPENMKPFTPRDCRRTWKTLAGSIGLDLEIRNRVQGHVMIDVGSVHYDRNDYLDQKRKAMQRFTAWLETVISGQPNVVPMEKRGER